MTAEASSFPLAYFITWTTYGTWLHGDDRGWHERGKGMRLPDLPRYLRAAMRMEEDALELSIEERRTVEATIQRHCEIRSWQLFAVNCRSNHVHVVCAAPIHAARIRNELKAYCTRALKSQRCQKDRLRWWSERAYVAYIDRPQDLDTVVQYVLDAQDRMDRNSPE